MSGLFEVQAANLALDRATNADVENYAEHMIEDHSVANQQLIDTAITNGFSVPDALDEKYQRIYNELAALSGAAFDKRYMTEMVNSHNEAISLFEEATREVNNGPLKRWAQATLPALRTHRDQAVQLKTITDPL